MMKQALYGTGFIVATLGLLWFGLAPLPEENTNYNEVSRAQPDLIGLTPAIPQAAMTQPVQPAPVTEAVAQPEAAPVAEPAPQPVIAEPAPATSAVPASGDAMEQMRAMSYGIMQEMKHKKAKPAAAPAPAQQEASLAPAPVVQPAPQTAPQGQQYTVKAGDSLPGIAFRFYGTTVAYLQIIEANEATLGGSTDLKPGMVLTIPGT